MTGNFHESFETDTPDMPSERATALVLAAVAVFVGWLYLDLVAVALPALSVAFILAVMSLLAPRRLAPLNRAWFALSLMLNRIVSPLVMGVLYGLVIVPYGVALQRARDPLQRARKPVGDSYWQPPSRGDSTMRDQF